ncbi:uncharacterized protein LOC126191543 isoform X1 [Schistocerca cancellata]|uniref:uncharacterized protein LOC126191543 isoform X1 n=1 Tax=Schistocerca cancellata TaxID=274614 RepID=UPI002117D817|nr:uncharacterized protein LOC126191543 isoform X1 [Schistocerca cancellata]
MYSALTGGHRDRGMRISGDIGEAQQLWGLSLVQSISSIRRRRRKTMRHQQQSHHSTVMQNRIKWKGSRANMPSSVATSRPVATSAAISSRPAATASSVSEPVGATWDPVAHVAHLMEQDKEFLLSIPVIDLCDKDN